MRDDDHGIVTLQRWSHDIIHLLHYVGPLQVGMGLAKDTQRYCALERRNFLDESSRRLQQALVGTSSLCNGFAPSFALNILFFGTSLDSHLRERRASEFCEIVWRILDPLGHGGKILLGFR